MKNSVPASDLRVAASRVLFLLASAVWLGGLMFYAGIVVPVGADVLGSHRAFGFVTRAVTPWLNGIGCAVAVMVLLSSWFGAPRSRRLTVQVWGSALVFAAAQVALLILHPWLDSLLDPQPREVLDEEAFYLRHRVYLLVTTVAFVALVAHWIAALLGWRRQDRG